MRKWYVPLTVAGIGGVGVFLFSESGRMALRWIGQYIRLNSEGLLEWNDAAEAELRRVQEALTAIAESLQPRTELGHEANLGG
jgi:ribonuclease HI